MLLSEQQLLIILRGLVLLKKQEIPDTKDEIHDLKEGVRFLKVRSAASRRKSAAWRMRSHCVTGLLMAMEKGGYSVFGGLGT